jgi:ABC-type multidrug transport system fused ATPase/permease subunit
LAFKVRKSTTVKGIVQLPTQAQVDARTTTGSTSALLALTPDLQRSTQLSDYVRQLPRGLDTLVGERGARISGGQRQRLGIARAMFTRPKLLVLDEATSSLDGQTESDISDAIQGLKGSVTVVMIAHRLSTVRNADQVIFMDKGKILARGSLDRKSVV